jgi:hypothetical protein
MSIKDDFLKAIHEKRMVRVKLNSKSKGIIKRKCIPFDFGPGTNIRDGLDRYHFYDLESPDTGSHVLLQLPERVLELELLQETFDPKTYVTWPAPYKWHVKRDWGEYS